MNRSSFLLLLTVIMAALGAGLLQADPPDDLDLLDGATLKKQMTARLKAIDTLKNAAKVGENNQGILTERQKLSESESALVKAENADRLAVYQLIAAKTGESAKVVGRKRAEALRKSSKVGVWLQDAKGKWYKKV